MAPISQHRKVFFWLTCRTLQWKFEPFQASRSKDIVIIAKKALKWPIYGPDMIIPIEHNMDMSLRPIPKSFNSLACLVTRMIS